MSETTRHMPLSGQKIDFTGLTITPVDAGMIMLQKSGKLAKTPFAMPEFGTLDVFEGTCRLSVMPDSWLITCWLENVDKIIAEYQAKVGDATIVLTDMSDQYLQFDVSGAHARALFAKGCEVDLSLDKFIKNSTARTLLAHLNVVIWRGDGDDLSFLIDASFADHLWLWLDGATQEYSQA